MQLIVVDSKSECYQEMPQSDCRPTHDNPLEHRFVCLFDLIFYVPVNNLSVMLGRVFLS